VLEYVIKMDKFTIKNNLSTENLPKTAGVYCFLDKKEASS